MQNFSDFIMKCTIFEEHSSSCVVYSRFSGALFPVLMIDGAYDRLAKIYAKYFGHMTKMAATPIYGKNPLKIFFSRTGRLMTLGLGM